MENGNIKIAMLIDGDNAQAKLLEPILEEASKYGRVTIRRIYGDWTEPFMNSWKELLNNLSFTPIQKFSYTKGKNSTDGALIIDAMDILHDKLVEGFCIVSSDSDYTGLAKRIREDGVFVMGIGEKKTPNAFVQSCEVFTYCENIVRNEERTSKTKKKTTTKKSLPRKLTRMIDKAYEMSAGEAYDPTVAKIGISLRKIDPSFDTRDYGYSKLTDILKEMKTYDLIDNYIGNVNHHIFRKK